MQNLGANMDRDNPEMSNCLGPLSHPSFSSFLFFVVVLFIYLNQGAPFLFSNVECIDLSEQASEQAKREGKGGGERRQRDRRGVVVPPDAFTASFWYVPGPRREAQIPSTSSLSRLHRSSPQRRRRLSRANSSPLAGGRRLQLPRCSATPGPAARRGGSPWGSEVRRRPRPLTSELREPFSTCLVRAITSVPQVFTFSVRSPFTDWPNRACESGVPVAITSALKHLLPGDGESPGPKEPQSGRKRRGVFFSTVEKGKDALCLGEVNVI